MAFALILAAGRSTRFTGSLRSAGIGPRSKVHFELWPGMPVWKAAFRSFQRHPRVSGIGIICPPDELALFADSGADFVLPGGASRSESCAIGLAGTPASEEFILVHDAARPLVSQSLISRVLDAAEITGAAVPAIALSDSLKVGDGLVERTLDRDRVRRAQTPQAGRRDWLIEAIANSPNATDESEALQAAGHDVALVEGSRVTEKITVLDDFVLLQRICTTADPVVGLGYDIHAFSDDAQRKLILGGTLFEDERGLHGHSDADVVLHALVDAVLGSVGKGDIGCLFPDTDERWKNADSRIFLREAVRLFRESGAELSQVDITVIAESPKLKDNRQRMIELIAMELCLTLSSVNVKATTHERLGALGRGEGIAAYAVISGTRRKPILED